ncbi:MAG: efflux transporter outer membrane subunit, partial [Desulfobacteraceae bacterium]
MGVRTAIIVFCFLPLIGCAMVGPDYVAPAPPEPKDWIEKQDPAIDAQKADLGSWWTVFKDPVLDDLIDSVCIRNLTLRRAGIRILQARAELGIATGLLYPQTQAASTDLTYYRLSENAAALDTSYTEAAIGFDAAWELDFWGKFRRGIQTGVRNLQASVANYDDILVSLAAEAARTYISLRTSESRLAIALENTRIQKRSLEIAEARFRGGSVTELDVAQARALLLNTQSSIPRFQREIRQAKNALAILAGMMPGQIDGLLAGPGAIPRPPRQAAVGIPAELLRRRPDIRLAERQLAAQSAQIGFAKADLYPHFSLFGTIGFRASDAKFTPGGSGLGNLFEAESFELIGGPGIRWDILNYGRIRNSVRVQDARFQDLLVSYENTVLEAAREAERSIAKRELEYERRLRQAHERAITDELTQLKNRAFLEENLEDVFSQTQGRGQDLAAILIDLDNFKKHNDTFGHQAGDQLLHFVGVLLNGAVRPEDYA